MVDVGEDREPGHEDFLGAQAIAQRAGGQDERGKRDGVGRDHPLQLRYAAAERRADAVQCCVDDGDIELHDAIAETHRGERQRLFQFASHVRFHRVRHWLRIAKSPVVRGKSSHGWPIPTCDASTGYGIAERSTHPFSATRVAQKLEFRRNFSDEKKLRR